MGKSFYLRNVLKHLTEETKLKSISSDAIRGAMIQDYLKKNPGSTKDKAFSATAKPYGKAYSDELTKVLRACENRDVLFLDKNHPPEGAKKVCQQLDGFKDLKIKKVALVPCSTRPGDALDNLPFSLFFFLKCYLRVLGRTEHATLSSESPEAVTEVLLKFLSMFKHFQLEESHLKSKYGFDQVIEFDFVQEKKFEPRVSFSPQLKRQVAQCLDSQAKNQRPVKELTEMILDQIAFWRNEEAGEPARGNPTNFANQLFDQQIQILNRPTAKPKEANLDPKTKAPLYLSIDLSQKEVEKVLLPSLKAFFKEITESQEGELAEVKADLQSLMDQLDEESANGATHSLVVAPQLHMTCQYVGRNQKAWHEVCERCDFFFPLDLRVALVLHGWVYVPGKILTAVSSLRDPKEEHSVSVENKHPHVTLAVNRKEQVQAKHSNDLLLAASPFLQPKSNGDSKKEILLTKEKLALPFGTAKQAEAFIGIHSGPIDLSGTTKIVK